MGKVRLRGIEIINQVQEIKIEIQKTDTKISAEKSDWERLVTLSFLT